MLEMRTNSDWLSRQKEAFGLVSAEVDGAGKEWGGGCRGEESSLFPDHCTKAQPRGQHINTLLRAPGWFSH